MRLRMILMICAVTVACGDTGLEPSVDVSVQLGNSGKGGGGGGGKKGDGSEGSDESPLIVTLGSGVITNDNGGDYINGDGGVVAVLRSDGGLRFVLTPGDSRQVFIGPIEGLSWETSDVQITTPACCDLRAMDNEDETPAGFVKVKIRWNVPDGWYVVTMGSTSNCGTRGDWAHVTQEIISPDTTWVIQSVGEVGLCRVVDLPGKKNDDQFWIEGAVVDLNLTFKTRLASN